MKKMAETPIEGGLLNRFSLSKLLMRLFAITIFLSLTHSFANPANGQKRITLEMDNSSLIEIMEEIKNETGFRFLHRNNEVNLDQKVTIKSYSEKLTNVLDKLFLEKGIKYSIIEKQIVLTKSAFPKTNKNDSEDRQINGNVKDEIGRPLPGANVLAKGTAIGTQTDFDGNFVLDVPDGSTTLVISYIGYKTVEIDISNTDTVNVQLEPSAQQLDDVVMIGSRGKPRTQLESAVPIDVIGAKIFETTPQLETSQVLQFAAPSFHSTKQNIGHGTDHVDPISLRGLGADQTLVLINGKRRHASALMNVNGTVGRGQVGTDLNAIPAASIERIEVLRDGAAAQYGSDAIAGVINIVLKKNINKGEINVRTGWLAAPPKAPGFLEDFSPYSDNPDLASVQGEGGGENFQFNANYGVEIGEKGGFMNFTVNYLKKNMFNRMDDYTIELFAADDPRRNNPIAEFAAFNQGDANAIAAYNSAFGAQFGNAIVNPLNDFNGRRVANMGGSGTTNAGIVLNTEIPLNEKSTFYAFGAYNYRLGSATGFYRRPNQTGRQSGLWPLGFSPHLDSDIQDLNGTVGLQSEFKGWNIDISNNYGSNSFAWTIFNSNNASLGLESPTSFDAGKLIYQQNVVNLDLSKSLDVGFPLNTAYGAEFRLENFEQVAGQEESWQNYDGGLREAGSQVFPGYQPGNEVDKFRFNSAIYADFEAEFTEKFLFTLAGRYEDYSDFGDRFNWKAGARYKLGKNFALRGAYSTGFRAPSLPQKFFSVFTLQFIPLDDGTIEGVNIAHLTDDSFVRRQFGINPLKPETSTNVSIGLTARPFDNFSMSLDYYAINIKDRIGITGRFNGTQDPRFDQILSDAGLSQVQFMTNAVDTETRGLDFVMSYRVPLSEGSLTLTGAGNFTKTEIPRDGNGDPIIKTGEFLEGFENVLFNREEVSRIEVAQPQSKIILGAILDVKKFSASINATRFGEVDYVHPSTALVANAFNNGIEEIRDQTFSPKILTDISFNYDLTNSLTIGVSGSNIFNVYPDRHAHSGNYGGGMFGYSRRVSQFGLAGAGYNVNLSYKF